jgi:hypothetical protein
MTMAKAMAAITVVVAAVQPIAEKEVSRQYVLDQARHVLNRDKLLKLPNKASVACQSLLEDAEQQEGSSNSHI